MSMSTRPMTPPEMPAVGLSCCAAERERSLSMSEPPTCTAVRTRRVTKPRPRPNMNSATSVVRSGTQLRFIAGGLGTSGIMKQESQMMMAPLTSFGTCMSWMPGASRIKPVRRVATSQNTTTLTKIFMARSGRKRSGLGHHDFEQRAELLQDPRRHQPEGERAAEQLGHEGKGLFLDRRDRLQDTDGRADDERGHDDGRGDHQAGSQAKFDDLVNGIHKSDRLLKALHDGVDDEGPAVHEDEDNDLERQRDDRRRQHHHTHGHEDGGD